MNLKQATEIFFDEENSQVLLEQLKEKIENELQDSSELIKDSEFIEFLKDDILFESLVQRCLWFENMDTFDSFKDFVKLLNELKSKKSINKGLIENSLNQSINKVLKFETPTRNDGRINADFYKRYASLAPYIYLNHYEVKFAGYDCYQIISDYLHSNIEQDENIPRTPELLRNLEKFPNVPTKEDYKYDSKGIMRTLTLRPKDLEMGYFEFFIYRLSEMPYRLDQDAIHILTRISLIEKSQKKEKKEKLEEIPDFRSRRRRPNISDNLPDIMLKDMLVNSQRLKNNLINKLQEELYPKNERRRYITPDPKIIAILLNYLSRTLNENEKKDCNLNKMIIDGFNFIEKANVEFDLKKEFYSAIFYDCVYEKITELSYSDSKKPDVDLLFLEFFFQRFAISNCIVNIDDVEVLKERIERLKSIDESKVDSDKLNITKSILSMYDEMQKKIISTNNSPISTNSANMTESQIINALGCYYFENPNAANPENAINDKRLIEIFNVILEKKYHLKNNLIGKKMQEFISQTIDKEFIGKISNNQPVDYNSRTILFEKYIDSLIDRKINIFSEEGRELRNYLAICNINPHFDRFHKLEHVRKKYIPNEAGFAEEERILDEYIKNNPIANDETSFEDFLVHLQTIKLLSPNFLLPMKYVNYIIKQALEKNSVIDEAPNKYLSLVESAIEDLGRNVLSDELKLNGKYYYFVLDKLESAVSPTGKASGLYIDRAKCILIRRNEILNMIKDKDVYALDCVFHENTHADQFNEFKNGKSLSYTRFVMQKEEILISLLPKFYKDNYDYMFIEIEANERSALRLADYIDELDLSDEAKIQFLWSFGADVIKKCSAIAEQKKKDYDEGETIENDGKKVNVHQLFDEMIREHPNLLNSYPDLLLEYNRDGSKKGLLQLYWSFSNKATKTKEPSKVWELFGNLVVKENMMSMESFITDMDFFMENAENIGDACENIFPKVIGKITSELSQFVGSFSDSRIEDLRQMIFTIRHTMEIKSSGTFSTAMRTADENDPVYREFRPIDFLDSLDSQLLYEQARRNPKIAEEQMRFLKMADEGVEQEELYQLEEEIVEIESRNHRRNLLSKGSKKEKRSENKDKKKANKSTKKRRKNQLGTEDEIR